MLTPVSGTGRTMMASLQQAMQKGMPPDQAIQYVKSMATQGVAPLADLYAMMNQFQRLKQQQVQPPQTPPTIKDQLNALDQQRQMPQQQQMPQQGNIQQMQAGAPAPQAMDRGLGAIDAGLMEYPKFAGGGVVALAGGGTPNEEEDDGFFSRLAAGFMGGMGGATGATQPVVSGLDVNRTPLGKATSGVPDEQVASELLNAMVSGDQAKVNDLSTILRDRNRRDLITKVADSIKKSAVEARAAELGVGRTQPPPAAPAAAPPAPVAERRPSVMGGPAITPTPKKEDITDEQYQKLQAFRQREGLGAAREEMRQFLTSEEKRLDKAYGEDKRLAFADIGFKMAAAASRPGATFLGALAEGAMSGTQAMRAMNKELTENKRLLKQSMIKLKEADELEKEGDYKAAMGLNREARAEALKLYELRENLKLDREKIAAQREATAVSRDYTQQSREDAAYQRKVALREQILSRSAYPTLELQAANTTDPEKQVELQRKMDSLMTEANRRAGLVEETEDAAAGQGFGKRFRFDIATGKAVPVE